MTQPTWFYEKDGEAIGPFTKAQLESFLKSGIIENATLVWSDGEEKRPAAEKLTQPQGAPVQAPSTATTIDDETPDLPTFGKALPPKYAGNWETTPPHVFRRFFARVFDFFFFAVILGAFGGVLLAVLSSNPGTAIAEFQMIYANPIWNALINIAFLAAGLFLSALTLSLTGGTPGAYIFGTRILNDDYTLMSYGTALKREFLMFTFGCGFALPLVILVAPIVAFFKIRKNGYANWDKKANTVCIYKQSGALAFIVRLIAVILTALFVVKFS